jgi:AcrR family transcriptional regulator
VARKVGIKNATLHHHYPTKQALIAGVVAQFAARFSEAQSPITVGDVDQRLHGYSLA